MKIYTKTGDKGETGLFGGERVKKDHVRLEAYGTIDELNSVLGFAGALAANSPKIESSFTDSLKKIQNDLFDIGALLATPQRSQLTAKSLQFIEEKDILFLESWIDRSEASLPPLKTFILPGGSDLGASLHVARTVCRRAERCVVRMRLALGEETVEENVIQYLNRLSDLLFVLARWVNHETNQAENIWEKKKL